MTTLDALRVLDLSDSAAGAFCAQLFAGYGADVIAVEPPAGSALRRTAIWARLAAGKRSLTLDIETRTGRTLFRRLVEDANVVVETFAPGHMARLGLGFRDIQRIKQRIVITSITPFGQTGPQSHWHATALISSAAAGLIAPEIDPDHVAGLHAFSATAVAAHNADGFEIPNHVDISVQECLISPVLPRAEPVPAGEPARGPVAPEPGPPALLENVAWEAGPAPRPGEHTREILCDEVGLTPRELSRLRAAGVA